MAHYALLDENNIEIAVVKDQGGPGVPQYHFLQWKEFRPNVFEITKDYFNAGVILFSKKSSFLNHIDKNALIYFFNQSNFFEQTYMNYLYRRDALNFFSIDQSFNCMSVKKNSNRFLADFIHYAGNGYCPKKQRPILILKDYCTLYRYQISLKERIDFIFQYTHMRILKVINKLTLFRGY